MEDTFSFRPAARQDAARIWEIILQAKMQMYSQKKQQWDETYPVPEHIAADIDRGNAWVLCRQERVIAYGAVVFDGEAAYASIRGNWLSDASYVVVHRLAVADEAKHRGVATLFMQEVERLSREKGVHSFKVDTNFDNFYMQRIFEKLGFTYCGEIVYQQGSRQAYEKLI